MVRVQQEEPLNRYSLTLSNTVAIFIIYPQQKNGIMKPAYINYFNSLGILFSHKFSNYKSSKMSETRWFCSAIIWVYIFNVVRISLWPNLSEIVFISTPLYNKMLAWVWRKSWNLILLKLFFSNHFINHHVIEFLLTA